MKKLHVFITIMAALIAMSCSKDDENGSIRLRVSAVNPMISAKAAVSQKANVLPAEVIFTDFRIAIREVVFKNDDDPSSDLDTDEIRFIGPYQIDLLDGTDALTQTIGDVVMPDGRYREMRFKFHKSEELPVSDVLYDKSIYIEGTIDGIPFVFWHDTSENFDLGKETGVMVQDGVVAFTVHFDMSQFLGSFNNIDLSQATDGNGDGIIQIYPNDEDGNQDIADDLKDNIKEAADLM